MSRPSTEKACLLGIEALAGLRPEDKLRIVEKLMRTAHVVAKVGDGIDDAPALGAAEVASLSDLTRRTMANIWQTTAASLVLNAMFLATTKLGVTGLLPATLADTGATALVTTNALRLLNVARAAISRSAT